MTRMQELQQKVDEIIDLKGWHKDWCKGGCYIHLEVSEFIESLRGKGDSTPTSEAADVFFTMMAVMAHYEIDPEDVLDRLDEICDELKEGRGDDAEELLEENVEEEVEEEEVFEGHHIWYAGGDDWSGLYIDGKLWQEGHQIYHDDWLRLLEELGHSVSEDELCPDWLTNEGVLPENMTDCVILT